MRECDIRPSVGSRMNHRNNVIDRGVLALNNQIAEMTDRVVAIEDFIERESLGTWRSARHCVASGVACALPLGMSAGVFDVLRYEVLAMLCVVFRPRRSAIALSLLRISFLP